MSAPAERIQPGPTILQALPDPQLFGDTFQGPSWETQRAILAAAFALPMTEDQAATFQRLAGGREPPERRVSELIVIAGRRSGKTQTAAAVAVYLGTIGAELDGTLARLSRGERGVIALLAVDRQQAKVAMQYVRAFVEESPIFSRLVERINTESVDLANGISIEVHTNSYRAVRGRTLIAAIFDETAFWRSEYSANPDLEVYRAAIPALATTGGLLFIISSPYSKRGLVYQKRRRHYGQPGPVLVIQGTTRDFNPTIDQAIIDQALQDDPEAAKSEWLGEFRSDIASFLQREAVEPCVRPGPLEIPFNRQHRYVAFVDPAGGGQDEFTLAIGHLEGQTTVTDVLRGRRGVPAEIVAEYATLLRSYGLAEVTGDHYGGSWPADEFQKRGIRYRTADKPKSDLYVDLLPRINSQRIELPPDEKLIGQLINLERRTGRSGKDSIDHGPGQNDDRSNVIAGLASLAAKPRGITVKLHVSEGGGIRPRRGPDGPLAFTRRTTAANIERIHWKKIKL
jgi:hypothetical protein